MNQWWDSYFVEKFVAEFAPVGVLNPLIEGKVESHHPSNELNTQTFK